MGEHGESGAMHATDAKEIGAPALAIEPGEPVWIDGAAGEGGGQILRTSLALAMITGRPLQMTRIRAGRAKPGLRRQHLACVEAAARLCGAEVHGAHVGSQQLAFTPGTITGGELAIDIGTAGSATLVVQTILVPAIAAGVALRAVIRGGTHNPLAPPFEFLDRVWLPHLRAMGARVAITLDRHGFAGGGSPGGRDGRAHGGTGGRRGGAGARDGNADTSARDARGDTSARDGNADTSARDHRAGASARDGRGDALGQLTLTVEAGGALRPIELVDAGPIASRHATAILARLPSHVAEREHGVIRERLGFRRDECEIREVQGAGTANLVMIEIDRSLGGSLARGGRELVTAFGEKGLRAERVAQQACDEAAAYLAADVPVGEHLADQLLLPLAVAGGGRYRTLPLSLHATTNIATIQAFLAIPIAVTPGESPSESSSESSSEPSSVTVEIGHL